MTDDAPAPGLQLTELGQVVDGLLAERRLLHANLMLATGHVQELWEQRESALATATLECERAERAAARLERWVIEERDWKELEASLYTRATDAEAALAAARALVAELADALEVKVRFALADGWHLDPDDERLIARASAMLGEREP